MPIVAVEEEHLLNVYPHLFPDAVSVSNKLQFGSSIYIKVNFADKCAHSCFKSFRKLSCIADGGWVTMDPWGEGGAGTVEPKPR